MDLVSSPVSERRQHVSVVIAGFGQNFILTTVTTFILVYLLQYAHISVAGMAVVTGILAATKIFDAVSDPVMGSIIDKTRTRWGKMRPFILFSAMPVALLTTLLFSVPNRVSRANSSSSASCSSCGGSRTRPATSRTGDSSAPPSRTQESARA